MKKQKKCWFSLCVLPDRVMIPTDYRTEAGFYVAGEPITMVPISDKAALTAAISVAVKNGNPSITTPTRDKLMEQTALEKAAGFGTWDDLEKGSISITVWVYEDEYKIQCYARNSDRTWSDEASFETHIPIDDGPEAVATSILQHLRTRTDLPGLHLAQRT